MSWMCLMPACLFLRWYKSVRNSSLDGGGAALRSSLAHSPFGFETKLPQNTFSLSERLPVLLAQTGCGASSGNRD